MENQYICPHCRGYLKVGSCVVFKIRNTRREKGLLMMHQEGDNYSGIKHPSFYSEKGERIDFYCPLCMQSLDESLDENMVHVLMIDSSGDEQKVYFSRIPGEQSTYQLSEMIQHLDM